MARWCGTVALDPSISSWTTNEGTLDECYNSTAGWLAGAAALTATYALNSRVLTSEEKKNGNPGIASSLTLISEGFGATTMLAVAGGVGLLSHRMRPVAGVSAAAAAGVLAASLVGGAQVGNVFLPLSMFIPDRYR